MISTKSVKPFILLSKEKGISLSSKRDLPETLSMLKAETADVVEIGKRDNPEQKIRITTFRDKKNEIVELVHEYEGIKKPETHRLYRELPNYGDSTLKGKLIQLFENLDLTGRFKIWQKVASEKQYVQTTRTGEKSYVTIAKVSTDERTIKNASKEQHSLTEYHVPKAHGGQKIEPKYIEFETTKNKNEIPEITQISSSADIQIPKNDKYLAMRMYDSEDIKVPITRCALEDRGLSGLDIPIENSYTMKPETHGSFDHSLGTIKFNSEYHDKSDVIDTGFHESEHGYQYAILGITDKLHTKFGEKCRDKFKGIITPRIENDAAVYEQAHKEYVQPEVNYYEYRNNVLEKFARDAGERGLKNYFQKGEELTNQFLGMPIEEL